MKREIKTKNQERSFLLLFVFLFFAPYSLFPASFEGLHGLKNERGEVFLEMRGYDIYINKEKGQIDNHRTVRDIRKEYGLMNILAEYSDAQIKTPNHIVEAERTMANDKIANQVCFLFQQSEKEITLLYLETMNQRDIVLEQQIVEEYLKNGLSPYITTDWTARSINLAGKTIDLGEGYGWVGPHHVSGQDAEMRWFEYSTMLDAETDINNRIDLSYTNTMQVLSEEDVKVFFDSIPTLAYRIVYRDYSQEYPMEPLIVYYIAEEVKGKFVSCVLSFYGEGANDFRLPPLLRKVMSIREMPASAFIPPEEAEYYDAGRNESRTEMVEIQAGTWIPVGRMSNAYRIAPSVGVYVGYPLSNKLKLDIGVQVSIPVNPQYFNYYDHGAIYDAKSSVLFGLSARFHYLQQLRTNISYSLYTGLGLNGLTTDLKKEYSNDETDQYYSCETLDLFGGANIRYKFIGLFLEYHFVPYSISGKVKSSFGNSAINLGLMFAF